MSRSVRQLFGSMSVRLFLWLFVTLLVVFLLYAWDSVRTTSRMWSDVLQQSAGRTSEMIKRATYYGMLLNQKDDVHQTIRRLARGPGVVGIRIYDKSGEIIFSSDDREIGQRVNLKAEGCVICHDAGAALRQVPAGSKVRIYQGPRRERILGLINPIENEAACSTADCHAHAPEKTILGVLDVRLSMASADQELRVAERRTLGATLLLALLLAGVSGLFVFRMVRVPVRRLIDATHHVAHGDLDQRLAETRHDELGELAVAFNRMLDDLKATRGEVAEKSMELNRAQRQLVHMEKMASLGKLAATVAHELNNPIAGILNYSKLVSREVKEDVLSDESRHDVERYLEMIQKESSRCGAIVRNLLLFTRSGGDAFTPHALKDVVERALMVVHHRPEMTSVEVERRLHLEEDQILCDADQLQQALVALFVNAVEAMPKGGRLTIAAQAAEGDQVRIEVTDTGVGISRETMPNLFEPFFSTKTSGTGVGLGLAIVYGIVQRHRGNIEVSSEVGRGTTFRITLPRAPSPLTNGEDRGAGGGLR